MKPWRLIQSDRPSGGRPRIRPGVEPLEGRTLLSTAHAKVVSPPAAYKPPPHAKEQFPPYDINPKIESPTDGGRAGTIFQGDVVVGGYAFPYSTIWLAQGLRPGYFLNIAQANASGHYAFVVPAGPGATTYQVFAENSVQDYSRVDQLTVNRGNSIEAWDSVALHAIQVEGLPAAEAARDLAILHAAQYDAVSDATNPAQAYRVHLTSPAGTSAEAAANAAAASVLTALFPSQSASFASDELSAISGLPKTTATSDGIALGQKVAVQTLANRSNDGSAANLILPGSTLPGLWRPTAPTNSPAVDPRFARVTPFAIASPSAFRPAAPPAVGTAAYDKALSQVSSLGRAGSKTRTADQAAAARFWDDGAGTITDPGHWNAIAEQISLARRDSLATDARLFAELDFALADAAIASADAQTTYDEWRPITAVAQVDPSFVPLLVTPSSPSYVSDNAAYGAAASQVLTSAFGSKFHFSDATGSASAQARSFASFDAAATEAAQSRIWGGVNFAFDAQAGTTLGGQVGKAVLAAFPKAK